VKHVYIILVNYKRWHDTAACLESLFKQDYPSFTAVVVDNNSQNASLEHLQAWALGKAMINEKPPSPLIELIEPPAPKPIPFKLYSEQEAELTFGTTDTERLILIQAEKNRGFAAGNNIALCYATPKLNCDYVWILNNDTLVRPDALRRLVERMETTRKKIGLLGCKVRYFHMPSRLQCAGGATYNRWTAHAQMRGNGELDSGQYDCPQPDLDLIIGASIFSPKAFVQEVGLMEESYFIYFEEQDWAERARQRGWHLDYEWKAVIYHKEGATIGANAHTQPSFFSQFYWLRNKLLFTRKFGSRLNLLVIYIGFFLNLAKRLLNGEFYRFQVLSRLLFNPLMTFPNEEIVS